MHLYVHVVMCDAAGDLVKSGFKTYLYIYEAPRVLIKLVSNDMTKKWTDLAVFLPGPETE